MPAIIIKIGYTAYLVRKESDATAVIRALAGAVQLESKYEADHEIFYPAERPREISMTIIDAKHIRATKPGGDGDIIVEESPMALVRRAS